MENISCCASQCKSRSSKEITLFKFPKEENLKKKWARKLKVDIEGNENFYVCSSHFHPKDFCVSAFPSKKPRLRKGVIPSQNLPLTSNRITSRRTLRFKSENTHTKKDKVSNKETKQQYKLEDANGIRKSRKKGSKLSHRKDTKSNQRIDCSNSNNDPSTSEDTDSAPETDEVIRKTMSKDFEFVDVKKIVPSTPATSSPKIQRFQPNILRKRVTPKSSLPRNPKLKSVGTQTELTNNPESQKIDFTKIIEILRKVIVGNIVKVNKDTFRIDECSINFKNENNPDEEPSMLIIQNDKFISSGKLILSSLMENCQFQRCLKEVNGGYPLRLNDEDVTSVVNSNQELIQKYQSKYNMYLKQWVPKGSRAVVPDDSSTQDSSDSQMKPVKNPLKDCNFDAISKKEAKVMLKRLPKNLVEFAESGKSIPVITETFSKNGIQFRKYVLKPPNKIPSVKNVPKRCTVCLAGFQSLEDMNEHRKTHKDLEYCDSTIKQGGKKQNDSELHKNKDASLQSKSEAQNISMVDENNSTDLTPERNNSKNVNIISVVELFPSPDTSEKIACRLCQKDFRFPCSRAYHERTVHGKLDETDYRPQHHESEPNEPKKPELCFECPEAFEDSKELDKHLLDSHHIVLKKSSYNCEVCEKDFITYRSLIYHQEKIHNATINTNFEIKVKCKTCEQIFTIENYYKIDHLNKCIGKVGETYKNCNISKCSIKHENYSEESEACYFHEELLESYKKTEKNERHNKSAGITMKRKYSLISENQGTEKNKKNKNEIFNKLEALLGSAEGSNDITIENIDE